MAFASNISANSLFLPNRRIKWQVAAMTTIVVFLILFLLQPFNAVTHGFTLGGILRISSYALVTGVTLLFGELYLIRLFRRLFSGQQFYLPLIWYLIEITLAASLIFVCKNAWSNFEYLSGSEYLIVLQRALSIAIFPLILLFFFLLGQRRKNGQLNLQSDQKNEFLSVNLSDLLFLQSEDNYTSIFYLQDSLVKKKILRGSLSSFEKQLRYPMIRCHRSYIVNLESIENLKGNSQGYQLHINHIADPIKVSRKYINQFNHSWELYCKSSEEA